MSATTQVVDVAVDLHGLALHVSCPVPTVTAALKARLAHLPTTSEASAELRVVYSVDEPPAEAPPDARVVYESAHGTLRYARETDELFARYGDVTMRCEPERGIAEVAVPTESIAETWLLTRPMFTLPLMEMARRRGLYPLHAACLARDGLGILVAGPSGSGKSTVAIALARAGLDFLGDDLVFHTGPPASQLRVLAFPDEVGIAPGSASVHPDLVEEPPPGWPKARLDVRDLAATKVVSECRPQLLVLLASERRGTASVDPVSSDEALLALLPTMLLTRPDTCARHLGALGALTSATRAVRARGRDVHELAARIAAALTDCDNPAREDDVT